jgi:hypothetical protein
VKGLPTRVVLAGLLLVALVVAGVVSGFASGSPDGLERVATDQGFIEHEKQHATQDGPFSDYETSGVSDGRISTGAAGIIGSLVVLLVAGGVVYVVRRRPVAD